MLSTITPPNRHVPQPYYYNHLTRRFFVPGVRTVIIITIIVVVVAVRYVEH